jgi:hypothetical protein
MLRKKKGKLIFVVSWITSKSFIIFDVMFCIFEVVAIENHLEIQTGPRPTCQRPVAR